MDEEEGCAGCGLGWQRGLPSCSIASEGEDIVRMGSTERVRGRPSALEVAALSFPWEDKVMHLPLCVVNKFIGKVSRGDFLSPITGRSFPAAWKFIHCKIEQENKISRESLQL